MASTARIEIYIQIISLLYDIKEAHNSHCEPLVFYYEFRIKTSSRNGIMQIQLIQYHFSTQQFIWNTEGIYQT